MQDGVLENFTGAVIEPYLGADGQPTANRGLSQIDPEALKGYVTQLDARTLTDATGELPGADVAAGTSVTDALVAVGLVESRKAAPRAINEGGASLNNAKIADPEAVLGEGDFLHGRVALLRRGRKSLAAARLASG